ncbi:hypothetical protein JL722_14566 [Aureococcus anophagefferens]|nr:hypothetical protein JL722_14566 [Aureococcus anophagefferens]
MLAGGEVMNFSVPCPHCGAEGEEHMCVTKIPYFKECVIMSFTCEKCGYRNSEVKGGGAVPNLGCAATLTCVDAGDLSRDILKSDTAYVAIPELDLELAHGSLGSVYTTVEGCLEKIVASLRRGNPFQGGDSADGAKKAHFDAFIDKIIALKDGKTFPFTIVMRDPLANSFVGPRRDAAANHGPLDAVGDGALPEDPQLVVADYARSWDEDEELGLHDIDTGDGGNLGAIPEEGGDDDAPDVDDVDTVAVPSNLGTDFHVKPKPRRTVDHPNPTFARGCDDGPRRPNASPWNSKKGSSASFGCWRRSRRKQAQPASPRRGEGWSGVWLIAIVSSATAVSAKTHARWSHLTSPVARKAASA